jgi:hypothetical protein
VDRGLAGSYTLVGYGGSYRSIDLKLSSPGAYGLIGFPLAELAGQEVALADGFGREGVELRRPPAPAPELG